MSWEFEAGSKAELFFVGTVFMNASVMLSHSSLPLESANIFIE